MTRLIPDWEIRITNFGLGYILLCLVVAIAALNTGNNGLYLVLAGMLAAMVVSGFLSRRNVRAVRCEIDTVGEVVATRPSWLKVRLENRYRTATAQALFFLHESLPGPLWVEPLGPGEKREIVVEGGFPRRGVYREAERDRVLFLAVDNALPATDPAALERFERAISRCAGAALLLLSRGGEVGFHARGVKVGARGGRSQRVRILEALARLQPVPPDGAPPFPPMRRGDLRRIVS